SAYYRFLRMLEKSFEIAININPFYTESIKSNGLDPIPVYCNYINEFSDGLARQLLYYNLFLSNPADKTKYLLDTVMLDEQLKGKIAIQLRERIRPFKPFDVINRLHSANVDGSIMNRLIKIFDTRT